MSYAYDKGEMMTKREVRNYAQRNGVESRYSGKKEKWYFIKNGRTIPLFHSGLTIKALNKFFATF